MYITSAPIFGLAAKFIYYYLIGTTSTASPRHPYGTVHKSENNKNECACDSLKVAATVAAHLKPSMRIHFVYFARYFSEAYILVLRALLPPSSQDRVFI